MLYFRRMKTLLRETTLTKLFYCHLKEVYAIRKEFAPRGSKFLPCRADPFYEGNWCAAKQKGRHKCCLPCHKQRTIFQALQVPLNYCSNAISHFDSFKMAASMSS